MLEVACALIVNEGRVLCAQRSEQMRHPLSWEFPGGKLETGESAQQCIVREIKEELNLEIEVVQEGPITYHEYQAGEKLALIALVCHFKSGEIILREHAQIRWLPARELATLNWAAADLEIVAWWEQHWQQFA